MSNKDTNINSKDYWENRFSSGDWGDRDGYIQTVNHAITQVRWMNIARDFTGTIVDFGCGAGDAFPIYKQSWPLASLIGVDFSESAIELCKVRFGNFANFICGGIDVVPPADVIICSHVLEHLEDDQASVHKLLRKSKDFNQFRLFIIVPYAEYPLHHEHFRSYDRNYFSEFNVVTIKVFKKAPISINSIFQELKFTIKNINRFLSGKKLHHQGLQILYEITPSGRNLDSSKQ